MAKNAYFGTDTGNFGTGTAMYDLIYGGSLKKGSNISILMGAALSIIYVCVSFGQIYSISVLV